MKIEEMNRPSSRITISRALRSLLRGAGQVMFQQSALCGALFVAGLFWGAWSQGRIVVAWGALAGLLAATLTGHLLRMEPDDGARGLWGFNGILTGAALMSFLRPTLGVWVVLLLTSAATVWVRRGMNRVMAPWQVNSLTMPFVLMCWLMLLAAHALKGLPADGLPAPHLMELQASPLSLTPRLLIEGWLKGISQVFLLNSAGAGALFLMGLFWANRWSALWAMVGSALALGVACAYGAPAEAWSEGLYGFSPVLTGIALGSIFYPPSWRSALWSICGIVLTLFVQLGVDAALAPLGIPSLTAPFCLTTWLFLLPMFKLERHPHKAPFTPEADHSDWSEEKKPHLQ